MLVDPQTVRERLCELASRPSVFSQAVLLASTLHLHSLDTSHSTFKMHLRAVIFSALPPILLYPSNAWCLTVRDRFWVDFDSDVPGNCGSYSDKLDNAVTELPAMLRETTRALNLIRDPVENLPEGSVERADWYYFMMLFSALFDPLQTAEPTDDFSSQTDHLDPAGLDDSDVWDEVRGGSHFSQMTRRRLALLIRTLSSYDRTPVHWREHPIRRQETSRLRERLVSIQGCRRGGPHLANAKPHKRREEAHETDVLRCVDGSGNFLIIDCCVPLT